METSTKFSTAELALTVTNCIISKMFLTYPSSFAKLAYSSGIILALCTVLLGGVFFGIIIWLYGNRRRCITALITNKYVRVVTTVIVCSLFTVNTALFVRLVAESLKVSILPSSPIFFVSLIFVIGLLVCSHTGLKAIVRAHSLILPFTLGVLLLLVISSIGNFDFTNIYPIFGRGVGMFGYLWMLCSYFADFLVFLLLIPFGSEKASFKKTTAIVYGISSAVLVGVIALYTLVLPQSDVQSSFFIPVYRIAEYINYKSFMSRLEPLFTVGWMLSFFGNGAIYLYLTSMLAGRLFNTKSNRPFMYGLSVLILILSLVPKNTAQLTDWSGWLSVPRFIICIILPIVILWINRIREAKKR